MQQGDNLDFNNIAKPINVPSPTNVGDGVNKSYADTLVAGTGAVIFTAYYEDDTETSQTTTSFIDKINQTLNILVAGNYIIEATFSCKSAVANRGVNIELLVGGISIGIVNQVQFRSSAPIDYPCYSFFKRLNLTTGNKVIQMRYSSTTAATQAFIKNARILITKA